MNTQFVDEFLLKSLCATLLDVFPYVRVYQWDPEVLFFLGSDAPLNVELDMARTGRPINDAILSYLEKGVGSVEDVVAAVAMDQENIEAFASGGQLITDNNNYLATGSTRAMDRDVVLRRDRLYGILKQHDPLTQPQSMLRSALGSELNFPYISRRMEDSGMLQRAMDLADSLVAVGNSQSLIMIGLGQERQGNREESQRNLGLALVADPENQQARFALLQPWLRSITTDEEVPDYVDEELRKLGGTAAATLGGLTAVQDDDMYELVRLDADLASVLPSDLWYATSVKLRAEWRIRLTTPEYQPRMANEATALIDSAIVFASDFSFYLMRMKSTRLAGDVLACLETARRLLFIVGNEADRAESGYVSLSSSTINLRFAQIDEVRNILGQISSEGGAPQSDIDVIEATAAELRARLAALLDTQA